MTGVFQSATNPHDIYDDSPETDVNKPQVPNNKMAYENKIQIECLNFVANGMYS